MQITVEIPDSLAGQLHLGARADLRSLLQALVGQRVSESGLAVVQINESPESSEAVTESPSQVHEAQPRTMRPQRNVLARLRKIYGDIPMTGENAVIAARHTERY